MDHDSPAIRRGQMWRPRGQGLARQVRQVLDREAEPTGEIMVRYRTKNGDFLVTIENFRFWVSRLSASLDD